MPETLPKFPVDNETLMLVQECLKPDGPKLPNLLDILSGYDPENVSHIEGNVYEYHGCIYHRDDVIQALIDEVIRLRLESDA